MLCAVWGWVGALCRETTPLVITSRAQPLDSQKERPHGWRAVEALARAGRSVDLGAWIGTGVLTGDGATTVRPRPREGDTVL